MCNRLQEHIDTPVCRLFGADHWFIAHVAETRRLQLVVQASISDFRTVFADGLPVMLFRPPNTQLDADSSTAFRQRRQMMSAGRPVPLSMVG